MSFEWQTENERHWQQPDTPPDSGARRRRWSWLILLVSLLGAGVYLGWQQVQDRVDATTETLRNDVRASYTLTRRAAEQRDEELFVSLLSGRSATWTEAQKQMLGEGLLFGQSGRLFRFQVAGEPGSSQVQFNPDLSEAVLTFAQPVRVDAGSDLTETVVFTQTHVFRQGSQRWLLSPPDGPFWGDWRTTTGQVLRLEYAQRDAALARRLGDDLDRKLQEMCRTLIDCPQDFQFRLRLETDPQSTLLAARGEARLTAGQELVLPTPTLVGLPRDETAYAALFRGYATHVVSAALVERLDYTCCDLVHFQEALLHWQLSQLGLRSAPLSPGDYLYIIDAPLTLNGFSRRGELLAPGEEAPPEVHAFIDFLRRKLSMRRDPLGDLLISLNQSRSFWGWVSSLTSYESTDPTVLQQDWSAFVWEQAREAQNAPKTLPAELQPQQDIVAMCGDQALDVYGYSMRDGQWTKEIPAGVEFAALVALPGGEGYMMTGQLPQQDFETGLVTYMRRGHEAPFALTQERSLVATFLPWNLVEPGGKRMVVWLLDLPDESSGLPGVALVDPASCTPDGCAPQRLPGMPIWSPAGRLRLVWLPDQELLYLPQNETRWRPLEDASATLPFWLDEETFGYVSQRTIGNRHALIAVRLAGGETSEIVTGADLADALGPGDRDQAIRISLVLRHPFRPDTLLVLGTGAANPAQSYLFALTVGEGDASLSASAPRLTVLETFDGAVEEDWFWFWRSSHERYLQLMLNTGIDSAPPRTLVYDLQSQQIVFSSVGGFGDGLPWAEGRWSNDGRWFGRALEQAIDLVAPSLTQGGRPARQLIFHDFARCQSVTWVNR